MTALTAKQAYHDLVLEVAASDRPPLQARLRRRDMIFAVHDDGPNDEPGPFLGVVHWGNVAPHPGRIFSDLLTRPLPRPVSPDVPVAEVLVRLEAEDRLALPVVEGSELRGVVSRRSALEALLRVDEDLQRGMGWERTQRRLRELESSSLRAEIVTHDLANSLAAVVGWVDLLDNGGASEMFQASTERILTLLQALRGTVSLPYAVTRVSLGDLLEPMIQQARLTLPDQVELEVTLSSATVEVEVDLTDLERAISNLVVNAGEAMPDGGVLRLVVGVEATPAPGVTAPVGRGPWAQLQVADTGHGMSPELLGSVFSPVVSTKEGSKRGLGLGTAQRLIHRNHGTLSVVSEVGKGTVFHLLLPIAR